MGATKRHIDIMQHLPSSTPPDHLVSHNVLKTQNHKRLCGSHCRPPPPPRYPLCIHPGRRAGWRLFSDPLAFKQGDANNGAAAATRADHKPQLFPSNQPENRTPSHSPWIRSGVDKVPRLRSVDVVVFQRVIRGEAPPGYSASSPGLRFMLRQGRCTKTAASDLETTACFLGQLRDYVHVKS